MQLTSACFVCAVCIVGSTTLRKSHRDSNTSVARAPVAQQQHRARLDVGFMGFQKNLTDMLNMLIHTTENDTNWTHNFRNSLATDLTVAVSQGLQEQLKPLKQSIGKTWMALPKDEQKNEYVQQLQAGFFPIFERCLETVDSHLKLSLHHLASASKLGSNSNMTKFLEKSEADISSGLLIDHCYDDSRMKSHKGENASHKFCINSAISGLVHRLNDTLGLVSMTMRYDSGAMSLAQKKGATKK